MARIGEWREFGRDLVDNDPRPRPFMFSQGFSPVSVPEWATLKAINAARPKRPHLPPSRQKPFAKAPKWEKPPHQDPKWKNRAPATGWIVLKQNDARRRTGDPTAKGGTYAYYLKGQGFLTVYVYKRITAFPYLHKKSLTPEQRLDQLQWLWQYDRKSYKRAWQLEREQRTDELRRWEEAHTKYQNEVRQERERRQEFLRKELSKWRTDMASWRESAREAARIRREARWANAY